MTPQAVQEAVQAIRKKVEGTGGWEGRWAPKIGLTRNQVDQWACRKRIPDPWPLLLKTVLRAPK